MTPLNTLRPWEFWVKPQNGNPATTTNIQIQVMARNIFEATAQAEAIYGRGCARSPIVPKK
jgi:hypothetical protein